MWRTSHTTPVLNKILAVCSRVIFRIFSWEIGAPLRGVDKGVVIAAPHTSNWDFVMVLLFFWAQQTDVFWMGKKELFRWPIGGLMKWLGGVPVDRAHAHRAAPDAVKAFQENERLLLLIPPEGTRGKVRCWKRGFYIIAKRASVPICLGYLDYGKKRVGFGPVIVPSDDEEADMRKIADFYEGMVGKNHDWTSPVLPPG